MTITPCRLAVILAREAPLGVVFRDGPSGWVQLTRWHTDTDTFEPGQWFYGKVFHRQSDLSPDGTLLLYFAYKYANEYDHPDYSDAWTAISKPPYFTALALWPQGGRWEGGGLFDTQTQVWVNHTRSREPHPDHQPKKALKIRYNDAPNLGEHKVYHQRLERDGWKPTQPYGSEQKPFMGRLIVGTPSQVWQKRANALQLSLYVGYHPAGDDVYEYTLTPEPDSETASAAEMPLQGVTWADFDQQNRLVLAKEGKLFAATLENGELSLRELFDLNPYRPTAIQTPDWAQTW